MGKKDWTKIITRHLQAAPEASRVNRWGQPCTGKMGCSCGMLHDGSGRFNGQITLPDPMKAMG